MRTHDKAKFHDRKLRLRMISIPKTANHKTDIPYGLNSHQWGNKMEILRSL